MRIVFMGTPEFAVPSLKALIREGYEIAGVFTQPDRPKGRGKKPAPSPVKMAAEEAGIPVVRGFMKNTYIGRTFIKPAQDQRQEAVRIKLNPVAEAVKGKRVVLIDDSIVRGTTMANIVRMLREAGATAVHVRISSPPFVSPCYYGTDVPSKDLLIACQHTIPEICEILGADSLGYLEVDSLGELIGDKDHSFCDACFTGDYPNYETGIDMMEE